MARKDKKNRTCNRCGYTCSTPQMLRAHLNRKNPCRPRNIDPLPTPIPATNPIPIIQVPDPVHDPETTPVSPPNLAPKASNRKINTLPPQRTRLTINKRPDESVKEWAIRLADRLDKVNHIKQNRSWLRRRGENFKSCIENTFLSLLQKDPEVWQERERISGYDIEERDENGSIVTYICPDLDELNEVKDKIKKIAPHLLSKHSSAPPPNQILQIDPEAGPGPSSQAHREGKLTPQIL